MTIIDSVPPELIGIAIAVPCAAAVLGFFLDGWLGLFLLTVAAALASGLCVAGAVLAGGRGLLVAILAVGLFGALIGNSLGQRRAAALISLMWFGFCLSCLLGYWIGAGLGLLILTLPINILFWVTLYIFSGLLLPLGDSGQRGLAFRSLLTYSLGTNYPYCRVEDRETKVCVKGNPYQKIFGGPGIIITGCDHIPVLTDSRNLRVAKAPGLTFTHRFEQVEKVIDLRPQHRAFTVEARTWDGIPMRVLIFFPFRIHWGGREPALGQSFPVEEWAICQAITNELTDNQGHKIAWDDLVEVHATRIMEDILCKYTFDELCLSEGPHVERPGAITQGYEFDQDPFPHDPRCEPRHRIRNELVNRLKREMTPLGIEVIGGGISNLLPANERLTQQRIANWQAKWQSQIRRIQAEQEAIQRQLVQHAHMEVEQSLWIVVSQMLSESITNGEDVSAELLTATIIATLEQMAQQPGLEDALSQSTKEQLNHLRSQTMPLFPPRSKDSGE